MHARLQTAKRLLLVSLSPASETTIHVSVHLVTAEGANEWVTLPAPLDVVDTANVVRALVDRQPGLQIERSYSDWAGEPWLPWPVSLEPSCSPRFVKGGYPRLPSSFVAPTSVTKRIGARFAPSSEGARHAQSEVGVSTRGNPD